MVFGPNDATLGLSTGHSGNGPWSGVAGVAVAPIMSELIESHAIFNVFLCYTLYTPIAMPAGGEKLAGPLKAIWSCVADINGAGYITSSGAAPSSQSVPTSTSPRYCGHSISSILVSIARGKPRISIRIFNPITRR
jgi:hypothetical protein